MRVIWSYHINPIKSKCETVCIFQVSFLNSSKKIMNRKWVTDLQVFALTMLTPLVNKHRLY